MNNRIYISSSNAISAAKVEVRPNNSMVHVCISKNVLISLVVVVVLGFVVIA